MNELVTPDNIATAINTFQSTAALINSNEGLTLLLSCLDFTGFSLRDLKGKFNLAKFREKFKKELPEGTKNEKQESILSNSLIELQDYIKNSENLDDNVFEKIGDILINGIKNEDILTREYIKILKNLSWLDLSVFLESYSLLEKYSPLEKSSNTFPNNYYRENLKENLGYPEELLKQSINKFFEINILSNKSSSTWDQFYKTELGENIFNLIRGEK